MDSKFQGSDELLISRLEDELSGSGDIQPDPAVFHGEDVFAMEIRRIFFANWTLLDYAGRFLNKRECRLYDVAMRSLFVVRNNADYYHALHNRCLHAAYPVLLDDKQDAGDFVICAYHGWQYSLDGNLLHAPHLNKSTGADIGLSRYSVTLHRGLLYLAPVSNLFTRDAEQFLELVRDTGSTHAFRADSFTIDADWKRLAWALRSNVKAALNVKEADIQMYGAFNLYVTCGEGSAIIRVLPCSNTRTKLTITQAQPLNKGLVQSQTASKLERHMRAALEGETLLESAEQKKARAQFHEWYVSMLTSCTKKETNE